MKMLIISQVNFSAFHSTFEVDTPLCSAYDLEQYYKYGQRFNANHPQQMLGTLDILDTFVNIRQSFYISIYLIYISVNSPTSVHIQSNSTKSSPSSSDSEEPETQPMSV